MDMSLSTLSQLFLHSAMVVYMISFVFYAVDLANSQSDFTAEAQKGTAGARRRSITVRVSFSLTVLGFILHLGAAAFRGIEAHRMPYGNMYEFALSGTVAIVLIFLVAQFFLDLRFLGALVTGLVTLFLGVSKLGFYVPVVPLQPALDTPWLVIHITVAVLATGFLTLSFGLSILQLLQAHREKKDPENTGKLLKFLKRLPNAVRLEDNAYRIAIIGFVFWTFTVIAGAIWAERAWSRYWGWDVKEVWSFIVWVLYAGYIHARATRGWRGVRSGWLCVIAYTAIIFNFTIVNTMFKGLHSYSGLN
ncbi:MAG: c-type cytochrome biogenesis protein CcsB [Microbacteriaceae bacterium]|nr:c-type cytochrome biogenesis protein CcsB [Microbacteriaceae bacterium]